MDSNSNRLNNNITAESNWQHDAPAEDIDRSHVPAIPIQSAPTNDSPNDELEQSWCRLSSSPLNDVIHLTKPKTEDDEPNERDRCSPHRYPLNLPIASSSNDPNVSTRRIHEINRIPSKEEKQRQNEERKTPASSSLSDAPITSFALVDLTASPDYSQDSMYQLGIETSEIASESQPISEQLVVKPSACGACFIDASTLLDDSEDAFILQFEGSTIESIAPTQISPENPSKHSQSIEQQPVNMSCERMKPNHSTGLASKNSLVLQKSRENLNEDVDRDESEIDEVVSNLSDEQKMLSTVVAAAAAVASQNRANEPLAHHIDIKDQYATDGISHKGPKPIAMAVVNEDGGRAGGTDRQENERKQGHFLFQNSIQQYSGHVLTPKIQYVEENNSDFSLPSIYSGSSDPYTDNASAFETSSHHSSNCGDRDTHEYVHCLPQYTIGGPMKNDIVICPDTPHNSILQVNLSRTSLGPSDSAIESLSSSESNGITMPHHRRSHDDTVPILSGGASVKDFTPKQCDSPSMQRKTENCPIISVGMSSLEFEPKPKPRERLSSSAMNSWIVDMSDCKKNRRRGSESSTVSTESSRFSDSKIDRSGSGGSHKGLGFYVSLNDMKPPRLAEESFSKSLNYQQSSASSASTEPRKKFTGYFIDFSDESSQASNTPPVSNNEKVHSSDDKKNMFSMFIDIGNNGNNTPSKRDAESEANSSRSANGHGSIGTPLAQRRHPLSAAPPQMDDGENKRHSWTTSKSDSHGAVREHKRSISTSSDKGIMNILDKIPLISKTSSMSIDTPNSPYDDIASKSLSSCYSNNSLTSLSVHSSGSKTAEPEEKLTSRRRQKDAKINETFDKSSQGSITDDILSKNSSPTDTDTDTEDVTFHNENDDVLQAEAIVTNVMETIPEAKEAVVLRRPSGRSECNARTERHTMETLQATIEKQKQLLNTVSEEPSPFVKLSDMDKPVRQHNLNLQYILCSSVG